MNAKKALLFVILCCFSLLNCIHAFSESTVGKHGKGIPEEKFTGSHTADHHDAPKVILFLFGTCMLGALIRTLFHRFPFFPYELLLILVGSLLGIGSRYSNEIKEYTAIIRDQPQNVFYIFLPVVAFEVSYFLDYQSVFKAFAQIFILSAPLSVASTLLYATFARYAFNYHWNWSQSLMFGGMISNVDPVTVYNIVKDISQGTNKTIAALLQGEAVLRSTICIIVFTVFHYLSEPGADFSASNVAVQFTLVAIGSPIFGLITGKCTFLWLEFIVNDPVTEIMVTMSSTYLTFYIGEGVLGLSGMLATIIVGMTLSAEKTNISQDMEAFHNKFWSWLGTSAQTIVFMMAGVVLIETVYDHIEALDVGLLFGVYVLSTLLRTVCMFGVSPCLMKMRSNLTWNEIMLFAWVGIRGTMCLVLALEVIMDSHFDTTFRLQSKILFHCVGLVVLTMAINVTTLKWVSKLFGLGVVSATKRMAMASAIRALTEVRIEAVSGYKTDRFLADADWDLVQQHIVIKDPYHTTDDEARLDMLTHPSKTLIGDELLCEGCEDRNKTDLDDVEMLEMRNEARLRLLKAEKMAFWKQYECGMISRESVRYLLQAADDAIDSSDNSYIDAETVKKSWKGAEKYNKLIEKLKGWQYDKEQQDKTIPIPSQKCLLPAYRLCTQRWFDPTIMFCVVVNIVLILLEVVEEGNLCEEKLEAKYGQLFVISNYVFIGIYTFEAVFKIAGYRHWYFKSFWNWFDFLILLLSFVDLSLDVTVFKNVSDNSCSQTTAGDSGSFSAFDPSVLRIAKAVRLLRILRSLKLVKGLIPQGIQYINGQINKQLRYGYNVGKGFVTAEEEVLGYIDYLVDEKEIAQTLINRCNYTKETIIHELGKLQKENPGVAVSVKTHQAARRILNIQLDKVYSMRSEAIIDETEAAKLESVIQGNIKKLFLLPAHIDPPPPERILRNLPWLKDDPEVMEHIKNNARLVSFTEGETLEAERNPRGGLYIIISGLVKVEGVIEDNSNYDEMLNDKLYLQKLGMRQLTTHPSATSIPDETPFTDYLSTGQTVGEVAFLTSVKRSAVARCDTSVQLYHVLYEAVQAAVDIFTDEPSLEKRMWKFCAMRVGLALLQNHFAFRRWTPEKIRAHLDKGYIWMRQTLTDGSIDPNKPFYTTFDVNPALMSDIILVHGIVSVNQHTVTAPCYIPNTFHQMLLMPCKAEKHVFLIVPRDPSQELGRYISGTSVAHIGSVSSSLSKAAMCLKHASLTRASLLSHMSHFDVAKRLTKSPRAPSIPEFVHNKSNNARPSLLSLASGVKRFNRSRSRVKPVNMGGEDLEMGTNYAMDDKLVAEEREENAIQLDEAKPILFATVCDMRECVPRKEENLHQEMQVPSSRNKLISSASSLSDPRRTHTASDASLTDSLWSTDSPDSRQRDAVLQSWMISKLEEESGK